MNPCECYFNHEMAMRRLLSFLRQSQSECNDSECFDLTNIGLGAGGNSEADNSLMLYSMMWMVIGFLLFFFRPQSLRNTKNISRRSDEDHNDRSGPSSMAPEAH